MLKASALEDDLWRCKFETRACQTHENPEYIFGNKYYLHGVDTTQVITPDMRTKLSGTTAQF